MAGIKVLERFVEPQERGARGCAEDEKPSCEQGDDLFSAGELVEADLVVTVQEDEPPVVAQAQFAAVDEDPLPAVSDLGDERVNALGEDDVGGGGYGLSGDAGGGFASVGEKGLALSGGRGFLGADASLQGTAIGTSLCGLFCALVFNGAGTVQLVSSVVDVDRGLGCEWRSGRGP